jgi:hypothetical protein
LLLSTFVVKAVADNVARIPTGKVCD